MILTCPDCATRYFVDDAKLGGEGRTVRCAQCGARWKASRDGVELELKPEQAAPPVRAPEPPAPASIPQRFRARAKERTSIRRAVTHGVVWASMAGILVLALAISVIFRVEIVAMMPRAASAYAMAGLPVNAIGLTFEDISAHPALENGHAALVVSGAVRNIEETAVSAPQVRVDILDAHGKPVASSLHALADPDIPAGEARHFVISVLDPPAQAQDVEVAFALGRTRGAKVASQGDGPEPQAHAAPALRGDAGPAYEEPLPGGEELLGPPPGFEDGGDPAGERPVGAESADAAQ